MPLEAHGLPSSTEGKSIYEEQRQIYQGLLDDSGERGPRGSVLLCVSTTDLSEGRGDLYVALGLARALNEAGWGVQFFAADGTGGTTPAADVAIVMLESYAPGLIEPNTPAIAWVRNWADAWAKLPYLDAFAQIWCSSDRSAQRMRGVFDGPVHTVPLATDDALFFPQTGSRTQEGVVTTVNFWGVDRTVIASLNQLSRHTPVTWFGANGEHLRAGRRIDHRDRLDYFSLPQVYSSWNLVIDDVIDQAAAYGNQNSRLFDALACGALVVSNCRTGLAELGLDQVPTYRHPGELVSIVEEVRSDPAAARAKADRLRGVVRSRHTWSVRASEVQRFLEAAQVDQRSLSARTPLLRWATEQREMRRAAEYDLDRLRAWRHWAERELRRTRDDLENARDELERGRRGAASGRLS